MDNSLKMRGAHFLAREVHTPPREQRHIFHSVLTAGWVRLAPDYNLVSWSHPGHDLVLTLTGHAAVKIGPRIVRLGPGQLVWADNRHEPVSWLPRRSVWEFAWIRLDSDLLGPIAEQLDIHNDPLFVFEEAVSARGLFEKILSIMADRPLNIDPLLHAQVALLIARLSQSRLSHRPGDDRDQSSVRCRSLLDTLHRMRAEVRRPWRIAELARLAGFSQPQFFRAFRRMTGETPLEWLRRERVNQAKRLLSETDDLVARIAEQLGYQDPYYFSRDFRKVAGVSPRAYRNRERISASTTVETLREGERSN